MEDTHHKNSYKRSMLLLTRMRFAPDLQGIKTAAITHILEQTLASLNVASSVDEIITASEIPFGEGLPALNGFEATTCLRELVAQDRVVEIEGLHGIQYSLTEEVLQERLLEQRNAQNTLNEVLEQLFGNTSEGAEEFAEAFLECLCSIFSEMGELHIQLLRGEWDGEELVSGKLLENALQRAQHEHPHLRIERLEKAIVNFFIDRTPKFDELKWNLAQNYYVAKALGLDPAGHLLSADLFHDGIFYLDTNMIIAALEPEEWAHGSTRALFRACQRLDIKLRVCEISITELDAFLKDQWDVLERLGGKVPKGILRHIRSTFLRKYDQLASTGEVPDLDEVFRNFDRPIESLSELADVQLIEDPWFEKAPDAPETPGWMAAVQRASAVRRIREKSSSAILHDALLLQRVQQDVDNGLNSWLVTLDTSLPMVDTEPWSGQIDTRAITLAALLQWMSPLSSQDLSADSAASIFAEAVKYQVLPRATFFGLKDIVLFTDTARSIDHLPNDTLEELYEHISKIATNLDLSDASDREKFTGLVARYLADPANAQRIEKERREQEQALGALSRRVDELERAVRISKARTRLAIVLLIALVLMILLLYLEAI